MNIFKMKIFHRIISAGFFCLLLTNCDYVLKDSKMSEVENGLVPNVLINNEPKWNIDDRMQHFNVPGVSIAIIDSYKISWVKGYGISNMNTQQEVEKKTMFQAASITKSVTALLTMILMEDGVIDIDRDVNDYLKSWKLPENEFTGNEKVTIRRILSHTAGLSVSGFRGYKPEESVPDIVEVLEGLPPSNSEPVRVISTPGEKYSYSGGGYTVLQLVLEDVMSQPVSELAKKYLFDPANMNNSTMKKSVPQKYSERLSTAHDNDGNPSGSHVFLSEGSACCGLWTTAEDLAKFIIILQKAVSGKSEKIITKEAAKMILSPVIPDGMGLGLFLSGEDRDIYFSHSGSNPPGFKCWLLAHKYDGYGLVVMTNSTMGGNVYEEIKRAVANTYHWTKYKPMEYDTFDALLNDLKERYNPDPVKSKISERKINSMGYDFMGIGQTERAIEILKLNIKLFPESANCYDSLGDLYIESGDTTKALQCYQKAVEVLRSHPVRNKGMMYLIDGYKRDFPGMFEKN